MKGKQGFQKGSKKPPNSGRRKGVPTLKSASVMEALNMAFEGMGGWEKLMEWGNKRPDLFYPLWIKLLPSKIEAKTDTTITSTSAALAPLLSNPKAEELLAELANEMGKASETKNDNTPGSSDHS